jgi:S1-C subfamily serine protease
MTALDWLILAATALFAVAGYLRGLIVAALSLLGFVLGGILGTRVADAALAGGSASPYAPLFGLVGALVAGGILASGFEGLGFRLRRALPPLPAFAILDGVGGALFSAAVALAIAWVLGTVLLAVPDSPSLRSTIERSSILRRLDELLPPSGALLNALARIDPLPDIGGPGARVARPPAAIAHIAAVSVAHRSVVRIIGQACGLGIEGSGWVLAHDEVLTNAHVVAGETTTTVEPLGAPPGHTATVVMFDPHDDLAILHVKNLRLSPLTLAHDPPAGTPAAILGYPQDGPFDVEAARIGRTQDVSTQNAYGRGPVTRSLTPIRGLIRPGNSGGPLINASGQVVTTVFAATTSPGPHGGFGVANAVVARDLARVSGPVSTQGCAG